MTTDTLPGGILTSPCVRVTPAVLVGGVLGPSSKSMASSSPLRRAKTKTKKTQVKEILSFLASEFSGFFFVSSCFFLKGTGVHYNVYYL